MGAEQMKNFESLFAAYLVFWAVVFLYHLSVSRRLARTEHDLEGLKQQLRK
jgi:CcmD family protein